MQEPIIADLPYGQGNAFSPLADKPSGPPGHEALVHGEARHDVILHGRQRTEESQHQIYSLSASIDKDRCHHNRMLLGHDNSITPNIQFSETAGLCHAVNGSISDEFQSF